MSMEPASAGSPLAAPASQVRAGLPLLVETFAEWREAARDLLQHDVPPELVTWGSPQTGGDLFTGAPPAAAAPHNRAMPPAGALKDKLPDAPAHAAPQIPRALLAMLQTAACCRVPDRWAFLYRVIWRWQQGQHGVQSPADEDGARLAAMVKAVQREEHDMHAFIRFRERPEEAGPPRFVAWYEPRHDVLPQVAEHFVSRMGKVSWMIATPDASVLWDGQTLHNTGPLVAKAEDLEQVCKDGGEAPWLTYYRSVFNPMGMGARRVGQFQAVGRRKGATISIAPEDAQPERQQPSKLEECRRCELYQFATQAVGGEGPKRARIMLVGEQPGDQEDLAGRPFVGPAGKLLDRVCEAAGLDRGAVYVTNAVKHFKWEPRGKRRLHKTPAQREIEACHYWLDKELASVMPTVLVALGATALKSVMGAASVTLKNSLGKPVRHDGRWVVTTYHPSYVLRVPGEDAKREAFNVMVESLKLAHQLLDRPVEDPG
jgi:DNA polymerase